MTWLKLAGMILMISISCYAQGSQESCLLLLLDFEDRSGIENPLLADSNDTIAFMLSRQTGPVRMRVVSTEDRNALVTRAAAMQPDLDLLERGLLIAEWVNANALITGSYGKQGEQWTLEVQSMAFYFRITDHYGNAVPGLEFVSANEVLSSH